MEQKTNKQKVKTEIIRNPVKYLPTVFLTPKVIQTYSTPTITYGYNSKNQYYPTTTSTKTTSELSNNYYDYSTSEYYSSGQYDNFNLEDETSKYSSKTYNYRHVNEDNQERKTFPNYEYQKANEAKGKSQKINYEDFQKDAIYIERNSNYPQSNAYNLNNIYDIKNQSGNKNKTTIYNNKKIHNVKQEYKYEYYNNNMYVVQSGNSGKQKITQKTIPNNIYYNTYNTYSDQQGIKINENMINNKIKQKDNAKYSNTITNGNIKYKTDAQTNLNNNKIISNTNIYSASNTISKNSSNLYMNAKTIIDNKANIYNNNNKNYSNYSPTEINNLVDNSNAKNSNTIDYKILIEEPSDNKRKKEKNESEQFNNTMPNLKINKDISKIPTLNTIERKTYPIQAISGFEISFNNIQAQSKNNISSQIKNNNTKKKNKNYIPITTNNISLTNNSEEIKNVNKNDKYGIKEKENSNEINEEQGKKIDIKNNTKNEIEEDKTNQIQNNINAVKYFDTYTGKIENIQKHEESTIFDKSNSNKNKKEKEKNNNNEGVNIKKLRKEFELLNNDQYFNNAYPMQNNNINNINLNNNINSNMNQRNNRFENIQNNSEINISKNIDNEQQKKQQKIINIIKEIKTDEKRENSIKVIEPQKPKKKRPVFKIPPSKKRAISQGKSLIFIHKYYDENFILEEDNEDIGSDSEDKKNKLKNIFRKVTNVRKIIPQSKNYNEEIKNIDISNENEENKNNMNNEEKKEDIDIEKIEKSINNLRLSHIRFSLERSDSPEDSNTIINEADQISDSQNDIVNLGSDKENTDSINNVIDMKNKEINKYTENNQNNSNLNCEIKSTIVSKVQFQSKDISEISYKEKISDGNISAPRNSDSFIEQKNSFNNLVEQNEMHNDHSILNSDIYKEENINNSNEIEIDKNLNIENEKQEENDKRISLNIESHDLDKYFKEEGINKRSMEKKEVSDSLRTINLEENYKNTQIINGDEQEKDNLGNSNISNISNNNSIKRGESEEELIMIDEALKGSVHIPENIQDFVKKNNELYKDNNN